jgi:hypothetical protein
VRGVSGTTVHVVGIGPVAINAVQRAIFQSDVHRVIPVAVIERDDQCLGLQPRQIRIRAVVPDQSVPFQEIRIRDDRLEDRLLQSFGFGGSC